MSRSATPRRPRPRHTFKATAVAAIATVLAGLAVNAPAATAATPHRAVDTPVLQQKLDELVEKGSPGAVLYTYDGGHVTALQSGVADIDAGTPMTADTFFRIGSLTKTYVSTAVLRLVAKHRLALEDPVDRYLPGLMSGQQRVTVRQLLNHTSGLYEFNDDPRVLAPYLGGDLGHVWTPRSLVRIALSHGPVAEPGTAYHYANTNYVLAGLVVQAVTGKRLGAVLRNSVFSPAGLSATTFTASRTLPTPAAHGYVVLPGSHQPTDITPLYPYPWASGAAVSTAPDVALFYRSLLSGQLLPRRLLAAMRTTNDASAEEGPGTSYGLGLERFTTPCGAAWGHGGNFAGYVVYVYSSADGSRQTVLLLNEDPASLPQKLGRDFFELLNAAYCG